MVGSRSEGPGAAVHGREASSALGEFIIAEGSHFAVRAGDYLFHEGDRSLSVYACVEGSVGVCLLLPTGRELMVGLKLPGQEFGELSSIDERPRSAAARVVEAGVVATMGGPAFLAGLRDRPELAFGVLRNLARQLRSANARLSARNADRISVRVGTRLLELADLYRRHSGTDQTISLPITQTELAGWVGSTRESTARALSELKETGAVDTGRGRIDVLDAVVLEEWVRSG